MAVHELHKQLHIHLLQTLYPLKISFERFKTTGMLT